MLKQVTELKCYIFISVVFTTLKGEIFASNATFRRTVSIVNDISFGVYSFMYCKLDRLAQFNSHTVIILSESERAKDGDGFDQVGNNPCNSTSVF